MYRFGIALLALWLLLLIGAFLDLVPIWAEGASILIGLAGLFLMWLARRNQ